MPNKSQEKLDKVEKTITLPSTFFDSPRIVMSCNAYRTYVEVMKEASEKRFFYNDSTDDAKIVLSQFINSAKSSVRIFARSLNHEIYADKEVILAIKHAFKKGVHFTVMIQSEQADTLSSALIKLFKKFNRLVDYQTKKGVGLTANVCTVDDKMFRLEYNPDKRKAKASWNDRDTVKKLNLALDNIKQAI